MSTTARSPRIATDAQIAAVREFAEALTEVTPAHCRKLIDEVSAGADRNATARAIFRLFTSGRRGMN